jgi:hypothetical protein
MISRGKKLVVVAMLSALCLGCAPAQPDAGRAVGEKPTGIRQVVVEARWLKISDADGDKPSKVAEPGKSDTADDKGSLLSNPKLVVREGVRGSASDGKERLLRSEVRVNKDGALAAEVVPLPVFEGAKFEVLPTVSSDRKIIRLRVKLTFQRVAAVEQVKTKVVLRSGGKLEEHEFALERPVIESTKVDTEVELPDGGIVLLQGHLQYQQPARPEGVGSVRSNVAVMITARVLFGDQEEKKLW